MSPLKTEMLLRLHTRASPFDGYSLDQIHSRAMYDAFAEFDQAGLLVYGVSLIGISVGAVQHPMLSDKGRDLVRRICEVEP